MNKKQNTTIIIVVISVLLVIALCVFAYFIIQRNKPDDREVYKKFWAEFQEIEGLKNTNSVEYTKQKQILFLKSDLKEVYKNETRYYKIIEFYKSKLVELGAMKRLKLAKYDEPVSFTAERNVLQNVR